MSNQPSYKIKPLEWAVSESDSGWRHFTAQTPGGRYGFTVLQNGTILSPYFAAEPETPFDGIIDICNTEEEAKRIAEAHWVARQKSMLN